MQNLLSSIFKKKLEFDGKKYRTPILKEGINYIYQKINELKEIENKKGDNLEDVSLKVLGAGLEPARTLLLIGF